MNESVQTNIKNEFVVLAVPLVSSIRPVVKGCFRDDYEAAAKYVRELNAYSRDDIFFYVIQESPVLG